MLLMDGRAASLAAGRSSIVGRYVARQLQWSGRQDGDLANCRIAQGWRAGPDHLGRSQRITKWSPHRWLLEIRGTDVTARCSVEGNFVQNIMLVLGDSRLHTEIIFAGQAVRPEALQGTVTFAWHTLSGNTFWLKWFCNHFCRRTAYVFRHIV